MENLTWDDEVTLIGAGGYMEDELGQKIPVVSETTVCCCKKPTPRQEVYYAGQNGIKISETLIVHPYEYNGENIIEFEGKRLYILKTYPISTEELELTCTEKRGDKSGQEN
jgi:SPP1 family predicted phage head-tail adaptor|nr:MAG TPA: head closure knob [Caudoviricetes sp.]